METVIRSSSEIPADADLCPSLQLRVIAPGESGFGRCWSIQGVGRTEGKPSCDNSHGSLRVAWRGEQCRQQPVR